MDLERWLNELKSWFTLDKEIYGNTIQKWLIALGAAVAAVFVLRVLKAILTRRAAKLAERFKSDWNRAVVEIFQATRFWFLLLAGVYIGSLFLTLPEKTQDVVQVVAVLALLLQAALWANRLLKFFLERYVERRMTEDAAAVTTVSALGFVGKLVLWSVVVLLALDNLGVDVTALVAGLGVGGIAVALAAQNILGDLFASLSIVFDKPFVLGDFIIVGDFMGTVENIGLKTSRVRSLSGEQLVFSNSDLLSSRIRNYKRMYERRIVFSVGVTYQTTRDQLAAIPGMLKESVETQEQVRFDRAHFKSYGDFALIFEIVYYVTVPDYVVYMDVQQAINLAIWDRFEPAGIEFAYPTQTLFLHRESQEAGS